MARRGAIMSRDRVSDLHRLRALAQIKADAETARLAVVAQGRDRLRTALQTLGQPEPPLSGWRAPPPPAGPAGGTDGETDPASVPGPDKVRADTPPVDPAMVRARLAHGVWIGAQRAHLNARLAMLEADWRRLQPQAAQAVGRVQVLDALAGRAAATRRLEQARRAGGQTWSEAAARADADTTDPASPGNGG